MLIPLCIGSALAEAGIFIASHRNKVLVLCQGMWSVALPNEPFATMSSESAMPKAMQGRSAVNLMGNCLATIVVARWEGDFDAHRPAPPREGDATSRSLKSQ
jgi:proton glutamate symport protein